MNLLLLSEYSLVSLFWRLVYSGVWIKIPINFIVGEAMKKSEVPPGWKEAQFSPCACGSLRVIYRVVESSNGGHSDEKYECTVCGATWWVDGADA